MINDKSYPIRNVWLLKILIIFGVLLLIGALVITYTHNILDPRMFILIGGVLITVISAFLAKNKFHFQLDDNQLNINDMGKSYEIPFNQINDTYIKQGLFDKLFGVVTLYITTITLNNSRWADIGNESMAPGVGGRTVYILGLKIKDAEFILDTLKKRVVSSKTNTA